MNNMELVTDVPVIDMEMEVITRNYPVIPNPEGTPTDDISTMEIDNIIYAVKDETARTELENKVDKVEGKDLSTNDYTDEDKAIVDGVTEALNGKADKSDTYTKSEVDSVLDDKADKSDTYTKTETDTLLNGKVDKDGDKVLSDNNYSDTDKTKLDGIEAEANKTVVDNALDGTSANPVENRVVKSALDEKLNADETAVNANGLALVTPINDTAPYIYRQTPVKESFKALMHKIVGASVVWNQLSNNLNRSVSGYFTNNGDGSFTLNGTSTTDNPTYNANSPSLTLLANHVFLVSGCPSGGGINSYRIDVRDNNPLVANASWDTGNGFVFKINEDKQNVYVKMRLAKDYTAENVVFKPQLIDLTAMFGTTIADYVYTLEQATSGSGIAWLQSYGFFTEDYYAYTQNKLESGCVSAKKICGKNLFNKTRASLISATTCDYARNDGGIWLFEGVTYTLSIGKTVSSMGVYYYGGDTDSSNRIGYASSTNTLTFTPTKTTKAFIRIYANNTLGGLSQSDINTIQLEIGSTATSFEPYVVTTYPISPITLRGLFKLSTDKLTVDGDEYNADGSVT